MAGPRKKVYKFVSFWNQEYNISCRESRKYLSEGDDKVEVTNEALQGLNYDC